MVSENVQRSEAQHTDGGSTEGTVAVETEQSLLRNKKQSLYDPALPLVGAHPEERKTDSRGVGVCFSPRPLSSR